MVKTRSRYQLRADARESKVQALGLELRLTLTRKDDLRKPELMSLGDQSFSRICVKRASTIVVIAITTAVSLSTILVSNGQVGRLETSSRLT